MEENKILRRVVKRLISEARTISLIERKSDSEYISTVDAVIDLMKAGEPYFNDITSEIDSSNKMIYKVYELVKPSDEMLAIGFDELWITIINPNKDASQRWKTKKAEINPQNEMLLFLSQSDFRKYKSGNILSNMLIDNKIHEAIVHELTHQLNKLKAKNKTYRSSGGDEQFVPGSESYVNSTEEIQARLIPIIRIIRMAVERNNDNDAMGRLIKKYIANEDFKSFKEYVFGRYYEQLHLDSANEKTKKRYITRLYEVFVELVDTLHMM
jgi:hypothetical protein